ncbi:glycosyltransferase family 4 protein [Vallitalea sp.]|jgi:glycosyltransferase involved in cell wall biosynthesis|uniref:glycosyltransferase family 4 protein n=1 Tax=Vallitalea sp. TaxID=1882829 RepID=UPI0025E56EB3|nr:glycosyltransferase family 4 protein [Vallitalea sp.]MCT4686658.1 glycosyltransferase family 4 protein [Vallitalea sp.]
MKIGFPVEPEGKGGTRTWVKAFSNYCVSKGHQVYFTKDEEVDVFITLAFYTTPEELKRMKQRNTKILYRMDGIYYNYLIDNRTTIRLNGLIADSMKLADRIIYQSDFSKNMASQLFNGQELPGVIIYNGADTNVFKEKGKILPKPKDKKIILSIAYWGPELMAEYSIRNIINIAKELSDRKDIEFWVLGEAYPFVEERIKKAGLDNITRYNLRTPIPRGRMPDYIRTSDIILHTRPNDACSNLIIEAMNVGKPIVGLDLGSTPELLGDAGLRGECEPSFEHFPIINIESMASQLLKTFDNYEYYKEKIKERSKRFTLEQMCKKYFIEINNLVNN